MTPRILFILLMFTVWPFLVYRTFIHPENLSLVLIISLFFLIGLYDVVQKKNAILRDYPILGHGRYILKMISPELHQYFVESNTNGTPFNKNMINLVNSRANNKEEYHPFGTEYRFYQDGVEWVSHAMFPSKKLGKDPRVNVGGDQCKQPYNSSVFNISAMSFGALSGNAIKALNKGACIGGFSHNTGEGGLSPYHLSGGGDIVLQLGTSNFGFRNEDGTLHEEAFKEKSNLDVIKMIEIKLSQGAKPGHGGLLPAVKNTPEIAKIRMLSPHTDVLSPPLNASFNSEESLCDFIHKIRELSSGKPIGIKLCIGVEAEFVSLIKTFIAKDIFPDFITIDAAEGGTGAAPIEYTNHVGMRGDDALKFADKTLRDLGVRKKLKIIYAGKIISGFTIFKALCNGADVCNSARGFMFSLGCIQSLRCHTDACPTGVATQQKLLQKGLVPSVKSERVKYYHNNTVEAFVELASAVGVGSLEELNPSLVHVAQPTVK